MTGATFELDNRDVLQALQAAVDALTHPEPLYRDMAEYLLRAHIFRFGAQQAPDGTPWAPLSPRYKASKKRNKDKILILDGYLMNTLRYQLQADGFLLGSNRPYAALMHFGGEIQRLARSQQVYFKQGRDGTVGNRFVKKAKSNFAQAVDIGAHTATYPARPFLGTSAEDNTHLVAITKRHLENALRG